MKSKNTEKLSVSLRRLSGEKIKTFITKRDVKLNKWCTFIQDLLLNIRFPS